MVRLAAEPFTLGPSRATRRGGLVVRSGRAAHEATLAGHEGRDEIRSLLRHESRALFIEEGWVAEGAGAIGLALLEEPWLGSLGKGVAIVVSGRNVDAKRFEEAIASASMIDEGARPCRA